VPGDRVPQIALEPREVEPLGVLLPRVDLLGGRALRGRRLELGQRPVDDLAGLLAGGA
jgi:hypothetical protein